MAEPYLPVRVVDKTAHYGKQPAKSMREPKLPRKVLPEEYEFKGRLLALLLYECDRFGFDHEVERLWRERLEVEEAAETDPAKVRVVELGLSEKVEAMLLAAGYKTAADLIRAGADLLAIKYFGETQLREVRSALRRFKTLS